jgi:hypothetical protein
MWSEFAWEAERKNVTDILMKREERRGDGEYSY